MKAMILAAAVALLPAAPVPAQAADCAWTMTVLPVPAGYSDAHVTAAAAGGWSVGYMNGPSGTVNARWHGDQVEDLGRAFDKQTDLRDVNSAGVTVGQTYVNGDIADAVVYRDGQYEYLPRPPGARRVRAIGINDTGDIVGAATTFIDDVQTLLWPAASPGTVQLINPDAAHYDYAAPIDIDEQGRILIQASHFGSYEGFVRQTDGTFSKIQGLSLVLEGFRNGRAVGNDYVARKLVGMEWDAQGRVVHQLAQRTSGLRPDSGTGIAGIYRSGTEQHLGVWQNGVLTDTLPGTPTEELSNPAALTDDGVITANLTPEGAVTYHRAC